MIWAHTPMSSISSTRAFGSHDASCTSLTWDAALDVPVPQRDLGAVLEDDAAGAGTRRQHLVAVHHPRVAAVVAGHLVRHELAPLGGNPGRPEVGRLRVVGVGVDHLDRRAVERGDGPWIGLRSSGIRVLQVGHGIGALQHRLGPPADDVVELVAHVVVAGVGEDPEGVVGDPVDDVLGHLGRFHVAPVVAGLVHPVEHLLVAEGRPDGSGLGPLELGLAVAAGREQAGVDGARRHEDRRRDRQPPGPQLAVQRLGQAAVGGLAQVVGRARRHRRHHADRRRRDDHVALLARLDDRRDERPDPVDDAPHVDGDRPLPVLQVDVPHGRAATTGHAGVQERHVHLAVGGERLVAQVRHRRPLGHVGDDGGRLESLAPQTGDRVVERARLDVGEHDPHPASRHQLGGGPADAARRAGHHRDLAPQVLHACPPFVSAPARPASASSSSASTSAGRTGRSTVTPSASEMALRTAGTAPIAPPSPTPL